MDRAERLQQDFDIEPVEGVALNPQPKVAEEEAPQDVPVDTPDDHLDEDEVALADEQEQVEAPEGDYEQTTMTELAKSNGMRIEDLYRKLMAKSGDDLMSISDLSNSRVELLQQTQALQQEIQQLQEKTQQASYASIAQAVSPEAMALKSKADFLEEQYQGIQWDQIDPTQRADLKIDYDRQIQMLRRQAQEKQYQHQAELDQKRRQYEMDAHRETLRLIPEWNSRDVYETEQTAIRSMLHAEGFPEEQIAAITLDPRSMKFVRKAWNAIKSSDDVKKGAKKIRLQSKTLSPSAKRPAKSNRLEDVGKQVRQAKTRAERAKARLGATFER